MPIYKRIDGQYAVYDLGEPEKVTLFSTKERALLYESYKTALANHAYEKVAKRVVDYDDQPSRSAPAPSNNSGRGDTWSDDRYSYDDYGPMGPSRPASYYRNPKPKKKTKSKTKKSKPKVKQKKAEKKVNDIWDTL